MIWRHFLAREVPISYLGMYVSFPRPGLLLLLLLQSINLSFFFVCRLWGLLFDRARQSDSQITITALSDPIHVASVTTKDHHAFSSSFSLVYAFICILHFASRYQKLYIYIYLSFFNVQIKKETCIHSINKTNSKVGKPRTIIKIISSTLDFFFSYKFICLTYVYISTCIFHL